MHRSSVPYLGLRPQPRRQRQMAGRRALSTHRLRWASAVALVVAVTAPATLPGQAPTHVVDTGGRVIAPVPPSTIEDRLQRGVREYVGHVVNRISEYDVAFPRDSTEFLQMAGNAILLVVAVTTDSADVPLSAVYAVQGAQRTPLTPISVHTYVVPPGTYGTVLGRNRTDTFYLLPVAMWAPGANLTADFPTRTGFEMGTVSGPDGMQYPPVPAHAAVQRAALAAFLAREYPGFQTH